MTPNLKKCLQTWMGMKNGIINYVANQWSSRNIAFLTNHAQSLDNDSSKDNNDNGVDVLASTNIQ